MAVGDTQGVQLFAVGVNHLMYSHWWLADTQHWSGWQPLSHTATFDHAATPSVLSRSPGSIEMFCRGMNGDVYQTFWPHPLA